MRIAVAIAMVIAGALAAEADEARWPAVLELFSSQGCSSCPPADAVLRRLAAREDVIALSLHVDYWDYIGWKDTFADPRFGQRQKAYAHADGRDMVYTPQMILDGRTRYTGTREGEIDAGLRDRAAGEGGVRLRLVRVAGEIEIALGATEPLGALEVHLVGFEPEAEVEILRGENAGRRMVYTNIVRLWRSLGPWDGHSEATWREPMPDALAAAVLVQRPGTGPIVAAARVP